MVGHSVNVCVGDAVDHLFRRVCAVDGGELSLFHALPWLKSVPPDAVHRLLSQVKVLELPMGEVIVKEGERTACACCCCCCVHCDDGICDILLLQ